MKTPERSTHALPPDAQAQPAEGEPLDESGYDDEDEGDEPTSEGDPEDEDVEQPLGAADGDEEAPEDAEGPAPIGEPPTEGEPVKVTPFNNPWRLIDEAPKDRIIEGRLGDEEVGQPIRWRNSRRRVGPKWVDGGVWHSAELRGAVELHPVEWREYFPVPLRFEPQNEAEAA